MDTHNHAASRPAKRPRSSTSMPPSETADNALLKPEIQRQIVSFLSAEDLCQWDLVCREFLAVGQSQWGILANIQFGASASGGKSSWKLGTSLRKKPIYIEIEDQGDFGFGGEGYYAGSAKSATNQSLLVTTSDDIDTEEGHERPFPVGSNGITIRDAETLNYCRTISSPIYNCEVAICGLRGCEILVTTNGSEFCAIRGNVKQVWTQRSVLPHEDIGTWYGMYIGETPLLSCETHLITATCGRVYLYDLDLPGGPLVKLKMAVPISEQLVRNEDQLFLKNPETLAWSECKTQFAFFEPTSKFICIWNFDGGKGSINSLKMLPTDLCIRSVVLSESFVVGTDEGKLITVWSRETGQLCKEGLCDVPEDERVQSEEDYLMYHQSMIVLSGDLLVASSNHSATLCVWNLRSGELLKRHEDPFRECPHDVHMKTMTYLNGLNTVVGVTGNMVAWGFPTDNVMKKRLSSVRRRERDMRRVKEMQLDESESSDEQE